MKIFAAILTLTIALNATAAEVETFSNFQDKNAYPLLIPEVQKFTPLKNGFELPDSFTLAVSKSSKLETEIIKNVLSQRFPKIKVGATTAQNATCRLRITTENVPESEQGYKLKINQDGIDISSRSAVGLFYGAQTLANIIRNTDSRTLKGCEINDYPDLKLRGVFFILRDLRPGMVDSLKKTIDVLAALKYNCLVLEFADNFPYENNPFTKRKFTLKKKDILSLVNYARERHFEVIPHIQALSHVAWLATHPDFKSMQEGKPFKLRLASYCPSNPKVIELMSKVITESISLLKPRYFHIGMDELNFSPWQVCDKCKKRDSAELYTEHVKLMEKKVYEAGATPVIYHDTLCRGYKGEKALPKLNRKDVMAFWRYEIHPDVEIFDYFTSYGFPILGVSYCKRLLNNVNLPKLLAKYKKSLGCYLTYWSYDRGYLQNPARTHKLAYIGTLISANYYWKVNATPLAEITYDPAYQIRRIIDSETPERKADCKAVSIPLSKEFNAKFGSDPDFPVFSTDKKLTGIRTALAESPEKFNLVTTPGGKYYGIMLAGGKNSSEPKEVEIPLNVKTDKLSFLMTASRSSSYIYFMVESNIGIRKKAHIGDLKLNFTDGSSETVPLSYRTNIQSWNTDTGVYGARLAMVGTDDNKSICSFGIIDFNNPNPGKTVKSLTFSSNCEYDIAPVLLAVSAFNSDSTFKSKIDTKKLTSLPEHKMPQHQDKIFVDFESGMGPAEFSTQYKYKSRPKCEIVRDMTAPTPGKVLKIEVPQPIRSKGPRGWTYEYGRVIVDVAIPAKSAGKTLRFDFKIDNPQAVYKSGAYVGNAEFYKHRHLVNFHNSYGNNWATVYIPISKMEKSKNDCKQNEITRLRVSFWTLEPMTVWIDNIGVSDNPYFCPAYVSKRSNR